MCALPDSDHPADPYPGAAPGCSFVHHDEHSHPLRPDRATLAGWRLGRRDLDDWLADHHAVPMAGRLPVLTYGSNRCPSKITWLRRRLGLAGPVVVLRALTRDVAAVWAAGPRTRDGQRPAVLATAAGIIERHAIWMADPEQITVLDRCEGRGERYRLARPATTAWTEDGAVIERPWCYLGSSTIRRPLLVDGAPVRCTDVPQRLARTLAGQPAAGDGLPADTVHGAPHPDQWPALLLAGGPDVPGTVTPLHDPAALLPVLDGYQGPGYRRIRTVLGDGTVSWAYTWVGDRSMLRPRQLRPRFSAPGAGPPPPGSRVGAPAPTPPTPPAAGGEHSR